MINIKNLNTEAIVSSKGGTVTNLVYKGMDIVYPQRTTVEKKVRGGIPICLPFFGPPKPEFAKEIPQHGWLRNEELELSTKSANSVTFSGISLYKRSYPWALRYIVDVSIKAEGVLELKLLVKRLKDGIAGKAPINPAFHPYFSNLGKRSVRIDGTKITEFGEAKILPIKNKVLFIDSGQAKIQMLLGGDFGKSSHVALWSDNIAYFCVEPILTHPDDFDTPKGKYLKEGESITLSLRLTVLDKA
jgi:D-hexose-6-phosphate mutarotase